MILHTCFAVHFACSHQAIAAAEGHHDGGVLDEVRPAVGDTKVLQVQVARAQAAGVAGDDGVRARHRRGRLRLQGRTHYITRQYLQDAYILLTCTAVSLSLPVHHTSAVNKTHKASSRLTWNFENAARWTFSCFSSRARILAKSFSVATEGSAASDPNSL